MYRCFGNLIYLILGCSRNRGHPWIILRICVAIPWSGYMLCRSCQRRSAKSYSILVKMRRGDLFRHALDTLLSFTTFKLKAFSGLERGAVRFLHSPGLIGLNLFAHAFFLLFFFETFDIKDSFKVCIQQRWKFH